MIARNGKAYAARVAVMPAKPDAVCLLVDVRNPQALSSGIGLGETASEEFAGGFGSIQLERLRGTLKAHQK